MAVAVQADIQAAGAGFLPYDAEVLDGLLITWQNARAKANDSCADPCDDVPVSSKLCLNYKRRSY